MNETQFIDMLMDLPNQHGITDITIETVRIGEWNEAICFTSELHPRCEIAAQKTAFRKADGAMVEYWNVFFVSPRSAYTISSGLSREAAYRLANRLAPRILNSGNPSKAARNWNRQ